MKKFRYTLIGSILGVLTLSSLGVAFYFFFIENEGGMALVGLVGFMFSVLTGGLFFLEQAIVRKTKVSPKKIFFIELILAAPLTLFLYEALMALRK